MTATTHPLTVAALVLGFVASLQAEESDDATIDIVEYYSYEADGSSRLSGFNVAKRSDYEECLDWQPTNVDQKLPLKRIVEIALEKVDPPRPSGAYRYNPAELRGVDFRNMLYPNRLWFWEVHFAFTIDRDSYEGAVIRDGDILVSVRILPNGGFVWRRPATKKEIKEFESRNRVSSDSAPFRTSVDAEQDGDDQVPARTESKAE